MKCQFFIRLTFVLLCACGCVGQAVELQDAIEKILGEEAADVHVGIEVVSMTTGKRLYQKNAQHLFVPASCLKMLTGAAALHTLGPDYQFETQVLTDGKIVSKSLKGNLYLQGAADPELALCDLEELIAYLQARNIQTIEGNLYVDHTLFDAVSQGPGWMWDEGDGSWNAPMGALTLNRSCVDVWVTPSKEKGLAPCVNISPNTSYISMQNRAVTGDVAEHFCVHRRWMQKENVIEITGQISHTEEAMHCTLSVEDPHLYTVHVFRDLLLKAGIVLRGKIGVTPTPPGALLLGAHVSRPLSLIAQEMMKRSDNLYADCLFKKVGAWAFGAPGTWQKGSQAMRAFLLTSVGIDADKTVVLDGSGLSRYNLVSAHQFVTFLSWMYTHSACKSQFLSSLPLSGIDGTLISRMTSAELKGKVQAKTGTMTGISSLSGYLTTHSGEVLAFCILQSGFTKQAKEYKEKVEDAICALLVNSG